MAATSIETSDPSNEIVAATAATTTSTTSTESLSTSTPNNNNQVNSNNSSPLMMTSLDYVGTKNSVMNLFSLPYSDKPVSVGIHNIEGCLIIDADPVLSDETMTTMMPSMDHPSNAILNRGRHMLPSSSSLSSPAAAAEGGLLAAAQQQEQDDQNKDSENSVVSLQQQQSAALSAISSMIEEGRRHIQNNNNNNNNNTNSEQSTALNTNQWLADSQVLLRESTQAIKLFPKQPSSSSSSSSSEPREYLPWNFSGMKMLIGSDAVVYRSAPDQSLTIRVEDATEMRNQLQKMRHDMTVVATATNDKNNTESGKNKSTTATTKRSYAEALRSRQLIVREENKEKSLVATQETTTATNAHNQNKGAISSFPAADGFHGITIHTPILPSGGKFAVSLDPPLPSTSEKLSSSSSSSSPSPSFSSPIFTVIDAYLDQLITNVPQLALVLREKGFVRSVKLVPTEHIPEAFMQETTFDTSHPFEIFSQGDVTNSSNGTERIFDPNIMQMNAASLLNFIRANCTKDNATYLLHREAGQQNIQLFDVSAISTQRQRKWIWWLAMMSYRFSHRLRHLSLHVGANASSSGNTTTNTTNPMDAALRRSFRARERSLLQNTLSLLEEFADMGGQPHEILVAEVCEKLGDTYLRADADPETNHSTTTSSPPPNSTAPPPALHQKYSNAKADALNKAQDYMAKGIKVLMKVWTPIIHDDLPAAKGMSKSRAKNQRDQSSSNRGGNQSPARQHSRVVSINSDSDSSSSETDEEEEEHNNIHGKRTDPSEIEALRVKAETMAAHLFSLYDKLIDISLSLSEVHLNTYWSSSAMQALRTAARKMADALNVCRSLEMQTKKNSRKVVEQWKQRARLQFTRLWELCGHFARSFAADDLWRERGHAVGDDVIAVLRDVDAALKDTGSLQSSSDTDFMVGYIFRPHNEGLLSEQTGDLWDLSGIVDAGNQLSQDGVEAAKALLDGKRQLRRDRRRVLVAACFAYSRATSAYEACMKFQSNNVANQLPAHEEEESKVANRESGSGDLALLNLLRQRQGDANNELAKLLLDELRTLLVSLQNPGNNDKDNEKAAEPLLSSAQFWFSAALKAFEKSQDLRNSVLLRCNLCQCAKIRANANFAAENNKSSHADNCLKEAVWYLQAAHETIGERDADPMTWDMVSNELAATLLVSGVRRRQTLLGGGNAPVLLQAMRLSPGETRSIVDPMEKALTIYEQSGNAHQAAAVHYQLALFYTKIWTCQRDEAMTREKLSAAFTHYKKAHAYFFGAIRGNEQTFVLLCLDLSNLYSTVSGEECLCQALLRCLDTMEAFSKESIAHARFDNKVPAEWFTTMGTLAASVEDRVFKTLRSLVKIEETNDHNDAKYKNIYRQALSAKMAVAADSGQDDKELLGVFKILQAVKEGYSSFTSSATS